MPGTIQVSVREFLSPQSSSSLSEVSLKISMGKTEYLILEMGDFSFPLINLRDNLIVTLENAEGIVISHSVIETKLVIKKGIWDDFFAFEGGGHVHMKLQFILSEEDRQRIGIMRLSALKKKHDELLKGEARSPKQPAMIPSYSASSLPANKEVSDSQKRLLRNEAIQAEFPSTTAPFTLLKIQNSDEETNPNDTDIYKDSRPNSAEETSSSGSSGPVLAEKLEAHKENLFERSPIKIRTMISAFESSSNQDMRPEIRPSVTTSVQPTDDSKESTSGTDRSEETATNLKNEEKFENKERISEDSAKALTGDKGSVSDTSSHRRVSSENLRKQRNSEEIMTNSSHWETNSIRASVNVSLESHGAWIFPDGGKSPCVTVGGKKILDLMGDFHTEAKGEPTEPSSETENLKEVLENGATPERPEKLETENSKDAQSSQRLVGKVVKAVITVGFATLVFFTRRGN